MTNQHQQIIRELRLYATRHKHVALFEFRGIEVTDPFYDETGRIPVDPMEYYGAENVSLALASYMRAERLLHWPLPLSSTPLRAISDFRKAAYELNEAWLLAEDHIQDWLSEGYPFDKSLDDVLSDIEDWWEELTK